MSKIFFMKKRLGFTMIELIMVIVIIGIIASVTLPKFTNFKTSAILKQEDYISSAINQAIKNKYIANIAMGSEPSDAWPSDNPFDLLAQKPLNSDSNGAATINPDNQTWRWRVYPSVTAWYIWCPHWSGSGNGTWDPVPDNGRFYVYQYGTLGFWPGKSAGDFWRIYDFGH